MAMNPLAYYDMAAGVGQNIVAGQTRGRDNALLMNEIARDEATQNALAQYFNTPPEERGTAINELASMDPAAAANAMAIDGAQRLQQRQQQQEQALREYTEAQYVLRSETPALALKLLDEDGTFLRQLEEQGIINSADGISDDEARLIAQWASDTSAPTAGIGVDPERADPAAIREMQKLGYPMTSEGFAQYNADRGGEAGGSAADMLAVIQAQLAIDQRRDQLERDRRADEQADAERTRTRTTLRNTIRRGIDQTGKIADLTRKLEGSFLEAGLPASSWRRTGAGAIAGLGATLGMDTEKIRGDLDSYDQLKKNLSDQLINLMSTGGLGDATNSKLEQYQNALASTETSPGAIMAIQANIAEILMDEADTQGFEVFDRDKVERRIEEMRGYVTPAGEAAVDLPGAAAAITDFAKATLQQIQSIDVDALTQEQRNALSKRLDELGL